MLYCAFEDQRGVKGGEAIVDQLFGHEDLLVYCH